MIYYIINLSLLQIIISPEIDVSNKMLYLQWNIFELTKKLPVIGNNHDCD